MEMNSIQTLFRKITKKLAKVACRDADSSRPKSNERVSPTQNTLVNM